MCGVVPTVAVDGFLVDPDKHLVVLRWRVLRQVDLPGRGTHRRAEVWVRDEPPNLGRKVLSVATAVEESRLTISYHLAAGPQIGGDHGASDCHTF